MKIGEAREKCEAARLLVRESKRIKREQDSANTFEAVAKEWLMLKDRQEVAKKRGLDILERVAFPSIGKLPVRQITSAHVLDILNKTHPECGRSRPAAERLRWT